MRNMSIKLVKCVCSIAATISEMSVQLCLRCDKAAAQFYLSREKDSKMSLHGKYIFCNGSGWIVLICFITRIQFEWIEARMLLARSVSPALVQRARERVYVYLNARDYIVTEKRPPCKCLYTNCSLFFSLSSVVFVWFSYFFWYRMVLFAFSVIAEMFILFMRAYFLGTFHRHYVSTYYIRFHLRHLTILKMLHFRWIDEPQNM